MGKDLRSSQDVGRFVGYAAKAGDAGIELEWGVVSERSGCDVGSAL